MFLIVLTSRREILQIDWWQLTVQEFVSRDLSILSNGLDRQYIPPQILPVVRDTICKFTKIAF